MDIKAVLTEETTNDTNIVEKPAFRRARTEEQISHRKEEILNATKKLFSEGGLDAVSFKAISELTSFTRQAIYKYYRTREEVLLDLLCLDTKAWERDILAAMMEYPTLSKDDYTMLMTSIFSDHGLMLELTSMLFNVIEENVSMEKLIEFRKTSVDVYHILVVSVGKYFPTASREKHTSYAAAVYALATGLYPMNHLSSKHLEAERKAQALYVYPEGIMPEDRTRNIMFEQHLYNGIKLLLESF